VIDNLPWGKGKSFTIKRYQLRETMDFDVAQESAAGDRITIRNQLLPPALDLIVLQESDVPSRH
jgi:hypothetical protein